MKATTRRGAAGGLPAANKKRKKKPPARGFMCGCGGAKSVSTVSISAVTTAPISKAPSAAAASVAKPSAKTGAADDAGAEGTPSVDSLLQQLRELERGVRALGVREDHRDDGGGAARLAATSMDHHRRRWHMRSASDWGGGVGRLDYESVAVVTESEDPLGDFRRSMVQMIVENGITGGAELRELLRRFLSLNAACHHHLILRAFADVWEELFDSAAGGGHSQAPPPPHHHLPPPAAEEKIISYTYNSSRATSKRPSAALSR